MIETICLLDIPTTKFSSATVFLDSSLKWSEAKEKARELIQKGFFIVWDLELIFRSFSNESEFTKNAFTIEHFKDEVLSEFATHTKGVILYKGAFEIFALDGKFQKGLSTHRQGIEYIKSLSSQLPDDLSLFLLFEEESIFLAETCFDVFKVGTKKSSQILPTWGWERFSEHGYFATSCFSEVPFEKKIEALLLPPLDLIDQQLTIPEMPLIPESVLTEHWEGIETLYVFPKLLTPYGKRALDGFVAAGGKLVNL